jgi:hypothetical protein
MIRLAFLGVLLLGGLIALGGFFLVRGSETMLTDAPQQEQTAPIQPDPVVAEAEKLYFLQGIDLDQGTIALVLFNLGPDPLFVRDIDVIKAAQDSAYVTMTGTDGQTLGRFTLANATAPTEDNIVQI